MLCDSPTQNVALGETREAVALLYWRLEVMDNKVVVNNYPNFGYGVMGLFTIGLTHTYQFWQIILVLVGWPWFLGDYVATYLGR